ncbi:alkaline phosphatase family protein-like protein [Xylona heveae TC161]|uniref:Alkaline phosphatase family protein-like protein n=1 Tax=Xylona heveae (strain CBS 132557 / TC161) TaxID=1328760 RepID=A0A165AD24_XYLHT|nr:alkaline phosphatase family protein-like protein [Xylona heveae TC161]KZF20278.1 alkaline phosphatase family protein-like protein [Xylona heveae TC161]
MPFLINSLTTLSSLSLRLIAYVFLRWIPGHWGPVAVFSLLSVYVPSFITSLLSTPSEELVAAEVDVTVSEQTGRSKPPNKASSASHSTNLRNDKKPPPQTREEISIYETLLLAQSDPRIIRTLLTGLPSPASTLWSCLTFMINVLLALMVADLTYHAPVLYPGHDLSFARVGFVSDTSAKILVREPNNTLLPLYVSYRVDDYTGDRWKPGGTIYFLDNFTDFTSTVTISRLKPDTPYQWSVSNDHKGKFRTAPSPGHTTNSDISPFTFLTSSCIKPRFPYNPLEHPLGFPGFRKMAKVVEKMFPPPQFMLFLGDFIYIDVPRRFGIDRETYRSEYRRVYSSPDWPRASKTLPWIHVYDDHEISNDWDQNTTGVYQAAADPWNLYHVAANPTPAEKGATYFSFIQGPAAFFLLDTRRYRSPEFDLPNNSSGKTMLGTAQRKAFIKWIREPVPKGVKWKIVVTSVPFTKNWRFGGEDTWAGYVFERNELLEAMWDVSTRTGVGFIVLSGDRHEFAATQFPPPRGSKYGLNAAVHEFSVSPLSMFYLPVRTYEQRDDEDVCLKYLPDGNSKFGAIEIYPHKPPNEQALLKYRLFIDGKEAWNYVVTSPPSGGGGRWQ